MSGRTIGISHRVKVTTEGEARPTLVAIRLQDGSIIERELETEDGELDFVHSRLPIKYRELAAGEAVPHIPLRHLQLRKLKSDEDLTVFPEDRIRVIDKVNYLVTKVPSVYDGLAADDTVGMILGGSGNRFAYALSRVGSLLGVSVLRIPAYALKAERGSEDTGKDHLVLERCLRERPHLFQRVESRDRSTIKLTEQYRLWSQIQEDRKACNLRLRTQAIGAIFLSEEGGYPQGSIEEEYDRLKATDEVLKALRRKEAQAKKEMAEALEAIPIYTEVLSKVEGVGPSIAAGIIAAVGDIRRFKTDAKLKAFLGAHVLADGTFPRRRRGKLSNWTDDGRQALYKFFDQMNRRPGAHWGAQFIGYKGKLRARHPEMVIIDGKKKYSNAHIHKMAAWRTLTKFVEWLYREWKRLEGETASVKLQKAA